MSRYSTDSLEEPNEVSPMSKDSLHERTVDLQSVKATNDLSRNVPINSKRTNPMFRVHKQDTGSNETTSSIGTSKDTVTAGGRNAIIASRDASKRRRRPASTNRKRDVTDRVKRNNVSSNAKQEEESVKKRVASTHINRSSKTFPLKPAFCPEESSVPVKTDNKRGNVLPAKNQLQTESSSYMEFYRRRFSGPWYNVRSPEGSTLAVWGDNHREQLTDDDTRSLPSPRDDQSETSFYRRIIEGTNDPLAPDIRSTDTVHQREPEDTNVPTSTVDETAKQQAGDKSKKSVSYRPYTIEEYKTLSIPKLDRSLGPDKVEMQEKREWLMRRRSYGDTVSARNRQRILLHSQKFKLKDDIAEKCFLPPLKDQEVDAKTQDDSVSSMITEDRDTVSKIDSLECNRYSTKNARKLCKTFAAAAAAATANSKKLDRMPSFCSSLTSHDFIEDSYLESLRQRHLYEKEMVDRIINQPLCPGRHDKQLAA